MNVENLTNDRGMCTYTTDGPGKYLLSVSREGYVNYIKEYCFSKTSKSEIIVPLFPESNVEEGKATIEIFLCSDQGTKGVSFVVLCPISII